MSAEKDRLRWRDVGLIRTKKNYTQREFGLLLGMSQSALSIKESEYADEYVDPQKAKAVLEAPVNPRTMRVRVGVLFEGAMAYLTTSRRLPRGARRLIELRPAERLPDDCRMLPTFIAVGGEGDDSPPAESESESNPTGQLGGDSNSSGTPRAPAGSTAFAHRPTPGQTSQSELRLIAAALAVAVIGSALGSVHYLRNELLSSLLPVTDSTGPHGIHVSGTNMGERKTGRPMPQQALRGQPTAPCAQGETTVYGLCWLEIANQQPPCLTGFFEYEKACFVPVVRPENVRPGLVPAEGEAPRAGNEKPMAPGRGTEGPLASASAPTARQ